MRLIRLLLLGALGAYLYKRFAGDSGAGLAETQAAEPYSSEQLDDSAASQPAEAASEPGPERQKDTLEQPTWLDAADKGGSAAAAGDSG